MKQCKQSGFSFIEILIYLFISASLLALLSTMIWNVMRANSTYRAEEQMLQNAQFIMNYTTQQIRPVYRLTDVRPDPAAVLFHPGTSTAQWFSFVLNNDNLLQTYSSSSPSQQLNGQLVAVREFGLTPIFDTVASSTAVGVRLRLTLEAKQQTSIPSGTKTFETYVGIAGQ